jgi:predicted lipoprotein with Yx(FWY)xxD motif
MRGANMGGMRRFLTSRGVPACAGLGLTAVVAAALLAGCSPSSSNKDPYKIGALPTADVVTKGHAAGQWTREGGTLELVGTVTPNSAGQFASTLASGADTVRVTVTGGDLASGLAIGRTIHDRKLALLIDGACAGPCADYWFPAAASRRSTGSGSWLGYVPDLSESGTATPQQQAAEAKLYTDSGVDAAKFHTALDAQLREVPGGSAAPGAAMWMPNGADLKALGYSAQTVKDLWLPPNLASANAQARAWQQVVAYQNTLVGLPPVPDKTAPAVPAAPTAPGAPKASPSKKA